MNKHAPNAIGDDRTLCGMANEGECSDSPTSDPAPIYANCGELVTCSDCRQIIEHCKTQFQGFKVRDCSDARM